MSQALLRLSAVTSAASGFMTALTNLLRQPQRNLPPQQRGGFRKRKTMRYRSRGRVVNGLSVRSLLRAMRCGDAPGRLLLDQTLAERARKGYMHSHARQMFYRMQQRVDPRFAVL